MLRMSKLTDYGTLVMTYMAQDAQHLHSAGEVSARIGIALPTVSKILKILSRAELVVSLRGVKGGYMLARAPSEITIANIIDAMEGGPIGLTECSSTPGACVQEGSCSVRGNWQKINHAIRQALDGVTLAEMARPTHTIDISKLHKNKTKVSSEITSTREI